MDRLKKGYIVAIEPGRDQNGTETSIYFSKKSESATISSYDPNIIRRLLNSKFFVLDNFDHYYKSGRMIVTYVDGGIPVGSISLGKPRKSNSTVEVVKAPNKIYTEKEKEQNRKEVQKRLGNKK